MIEGITTDDLRHLALAGAGLELNGAAYTADDLRHIASAGTTHKPMPPLIIRNSNSKTTDDLRHIALAGNGRVIFA